MKALWIVLIPTLLVTACTPVPKATDAEVSAMVKYRIDKQVRWHPETSQNSLIAELLQQPLAVDAAVQIALLNNPEIQAVFEKIGLAQADLVQAGLFQNPIFEGFFLFPSSRKWTSNTGFSVTQGFLDIFAIPLRKKVAETELLQAQFEVASSIVNLAFTVCEHYYSLQAEEAKHKLLEELVQAQELSYEIAKRQYEAGNINELTLQSHEIAFLQATTALSTSQNEIARLRKEITKTLGLNASQNGWQVLPELPELAASELSFETVQKVALTKRLDLAIERHELKRIAQIGATKEWWTYTDATIGVTAERDSDGAHLFGPTTSLALPFINHGQADRERLQAMLNQSTERLKALEIEISADTYKRTKQLEIQRARVLLYQNKLLPLEQEHVASSQTFYNAMALSLYTYLERKQEALLVKIEYTDALRDYWLAKVALDRAAGGSAPL